MITNQDIEKLTKVLVTKEDLGIVKNDIKGLKTDVSGLKTDVSGLKTDVSGLKTDVSGLKTDVSGLKKDTSSLKTDMKGLNQKLDKTIIEVVNIKEDVKDLATRDELTEKFDIVLAGQDKIVGLFEKSNAEQKAMKHALHRHQEIFDRHGLR